jgi:hypothetical protein
MIEGLRAPESAIAITEADLDLYFNSIWPQMISPQRRSTGVVH